MKHHKKTSIHKQLVVPYNYFDKHTIIHFVPWNQI